jgi:hypothetical protein
MQDVERVNRLASKPSGVDERRNVAVARRKRYPVQVRSTFLRLPRRAPAVTA